MNRDQIKKKLDKEIVTYTNCFHNLSSGKIDQSLYLFPLKEKKSNFLWSVLLSLQKSCQINLDGESILCLISPSIVSLFCENSGQPSPRKINKLKQTNKQSLNQFTNLVSSSSSSSSPSYSSSSGSSLFSNKAKTFLFLLVKKWKKGDFRLT